METAVGPPLPYTVPSHAMWQSHPLLFAELENEPLLTSLFSSSPRPGHQNAVLFRCANLCLSTGILPRFEGFFALPQRRLFPFHRRD